VPISCALKEGADVVIAVAVDRDISLVSGLQTAMDIYERAGEIQSFHLERYDFKDANIVIRPDLGGTHWTGFSQSKELISLGELAAMDSLPEIRPKWESINRIKRSIKRFFVIRPSGNG
jgi:NTE family protein